jgi:hypothetical protein
MSWIIPELFGETPPPRACHTTTTIANGSKLVIFGGDSGRRHLLNDSYLFDLEGQYSFFSHRERFE